MDLSPFLRLVCGRVLLVWRIGDLKDIVFALTIEEALADELFDQVADGIQGLSGKSFEVGV